MVSRKMVAAFLAEFLGASALSIAFYTSVSRIPFPLFTGAAVAATYGLLVLAFGGITELHANPAVTISMWVVRKIQTLPALLAILAQVLGGLATWQLIKYFLGHEPASMLAAKFDWKVLIAEALGTAVFLMGVAAAKYQDFVGSKFVTAVSLSLLIGVVVASLGSNAIVNPAIAIAARSWDWSYAAGPIVGGVVGVGVYNFLNMPEPAKAGRSKSKK